MILEGWRVEVVVPNDQLFHIQHPPCFGPVLLGATSLAMNHNQIRSPNFGITPNI
jgi:hypothetical protein